MASAATSSSIPAADASGTGPRPGRTTSPGIQPADVEELIENGSKVVILGRGMDLVLRTCPETLRLLESKGIVVHVEETKAAVALYNRLVEAEAVGGLFHSTC